MSETTFPVPDRLTAKTIRYYLPRDFSLPPFVVRRVTESTSTDARIAALAGAPHGSLFVAEKQTAGRGRHGHSFHSPGGSGLYFSLVLRPTLPPEQLIRITTAAAVAAAGTVETVSADTASIKWVNDIFLGGRKVCGILTEAVSDPATGALSAVILGVGMNVLAPPDGFPPDIADIAGAILEIPRPDTRAFLLGAFLAEFFRLYDNLDTGEYMEEYRRRSMVIGKTVELLREDTPIGEAFVCGIDDECRLTVRMPGGETRTLSSGEIRIKAQA